jgi:spermidine/putrescine transport system permease protein
MNKQAFPLSRAAILLWLTLFAAAPLLLVTGLSFLQPGQTVLFHWKLTLSNYLNLLDPIYAKIALQSLWLASVTTAFCLLFGFPMAYFIARMDKRYQNIALLMLIIPFWTSALIRIYAIMSLLKAKGLINHALIKMGLIHQPLTLLYTQAAVIFGMVYTLLPFMIMPLYASLKKLDGRLLEAAADLGASKWQAYWHVILPQSRAGMVSGATLVFLPTMTLFFVPTLLGGAKNLLLGNLIEAQLLTLHNWPAAAATSVTLSIALLLLMWVYKKLAAHQPRATS